MNCLVMQPKILFVIGDTGSGHYCLPLWEKWKKKYDWKILSLDYVINSLNLFRFSENLINEYNEKISFEKNLDLLDWRPDLIFSSASFEKIVRDSLIYSCKKKINGIQFFDSWYNYYKRLSKKDNEILAKKVCVIDKSAFDDAVLEGVDKKKLVIVGHPYFEKIKKGKIESKITNNIMFINQPISKYKELRFLNYDEKDVWKIVFDSIKNVRKNFDKFYFAMHPEDRKPLLKRKIIEDLDISLLKNGQEGLEKSDIILGIFSSLMFDALLKNKNVISIQPRFKTKNLCMLSKRSFIKLISDQKELEDYLSGKENMEDKPTTFQKSLKGSLKRLESFLNNEKKN